VLADDPAAENDVPAWCLMKSHDHVFTQSLPHGGWSILIRRGY
jgi:tRNA 2-thiouridine synthesizing protein A